MSDPALEIFNSLSSWRHLQALVDEGETEGVHLECKSLLSHGLNRGMKARLARTLSGFSNTAGGVVLWGVATTRHSHSKPGFISHLEPVSNCASFEKQVRSAIPTLTSPTIRKFETKLIKKRNSDTQGIIAAYIPLTTGVPLISSIDNVFYFRRSGEFVSAPHELIKRLFSVTDVPATPDVYPRFTQDLIKLETDGCWSIRILIDNRSTVFANGVDVSVTIENSSSCENITASHFRETSSFNPDKKIYVVDLERGIYRDMPVVTGTLKVKMKKNITHLDISITTNAKQMQTRRVKYTLTLTKLKFTVKTISDDCLDQWHKSMESGSIRPMTRPMARPLGSDSINSKVDF